jgi:hypothetical protein
MAGETPLTFVEVDDRDHCCREEARNYFQPIQVRFFKARSYHSDAVVHTRNVSLQSEDPPAKDFPLQLLSSLPCGSMT